MKFFTYIGMGILYFLTAILVILKKLIKIIYIAIVYSIIFIVRILEKIYFLGKIDYGICDVCYTKYKTPVYVCPKCKIGYYALSPSVKGVFSIKCSCGQKLPVTSWKREKLKTLCPECSNEVRLAKLSIVSIPVIGGTSSGKTTFIYNFKQSETKNNNRSVKLFDSLGSDFLDSDSLKKYKCYSYNDGFIFIIDPFTTEKLANQDKETDKYMLNDILDTLVLNLQRNYGLKPGEVVNKPIAFVITKTDLLDESGFIIKNNEEKFLMENGEELFLNKLKRTFSNYKFFTMIENQQVVSWIVSELKN